MITASSYDRERLLLISKDRFSGRNATPLLLMETAILHRFLKLSDAYCLLVQNHNIESAQQLLRLLMDCVMRLFIINVVDDPNDLCRQIIQEKMQMSRIDTTISWSRNKVSRLSDKNILKLMEESGMFVGMGNLYGDLSALIHTSYYHIAHLVSDAEGEFCIGGDKCSNYAPVVESSNSDFLLIQDMFYKVLLLS